MPTAKHNPVGFSQGLTASEQRVKTVSVNTDKLVPLERGNLSSSHYQVSPVSAGISDTGVAPNSLSNIAHTANELTGLESQVNAFPQSGDGPKAGIGKRSNPNMIMFPPDGTDYYIMFTFFKYERSDVKSGPKKRVSKSICLPIPTNLTDNYNMSLAEKSAASVFGFNLGAAENSVTDLISAASNMTPLEAGKSIGKSIQYMGQMSASEIGSAVAGGVKNNADYIGRMAAGMVDVLPGVSNAASFYERIFGKTLNPFAAMQFEGVQLRGHTFSFRLVPTDENESRLIKSIVEEFKYRMHPSLSNAKLLFNYPDIVEVSLNPKETLYKINPCFVESISVNYAPTGTPTFFAGTKAPTEIEMSISLKEIRPVTREDLQEETAE